VKKLITEFTVRRLVQITFALMTIIIGGQFILFVHQLKIGAEHVISRPPGVEAFLPISSLMSLKYWLLSGDFPMVHPSGLLLFIIIALTALLIKRGFCAWVCPFGLLNEILGKIHVWIFGKAHRVWTWLDYPLRSLKYLLLFFFAWAVLVQMNVPALKAFIYSPYNKVADIKMLDFFIHATPLTVKVLIALVLLSILVRNFWCCPMNINVHKPKTVMSDECHACLQCVSVCPVQDTLSLSAPKRKWPIKPVLYGAIIVGMFLLTSLTARLFGVWKNDIRLDEYRYFIKHLDQYDHARGQASQQE